MNGSDAASLGEASASPSTPKRHKTPGVMGTDCECPPPGSPLSPASSWQKSPGQALAACPRSWGTGVENAASGKKKKGLWACRSLGKKQTNKQNWDAAKQDPQRNTCTTLPHAGHRWSGRTGTTGVTQAGASLPTLQLSWGKGSTGPSVTC